MKINKTAIKRFVRHSLGCTCPDEVFETISVEQNPAWIVNAKSEFLLTIGDKLLVYVIEPYDWMLLAGNLKQIFERGRASRDATELNRFRLVVLTPDIHLAQDSLVQYLDTLQGLDERLHLHVISPDKLPQLTT